MPQRGFSGWSLLRCPLGFLLFTRFLPNDREDDLTPAYVHLLSSDSDPQGKAT